ncbi:MAG TPA: YetF domain-containing protein [Pyrinomonadaceae bacterium]
MDSLLQVDWKSVFVPTVSLAEIVLRGTFVYLLLFFVLRVLRREAGALGISDLLVVVLIADAAQNAMSSEYKSVTEGAVLVGTIVGWDYLLDWLGFNFPTLGRVLRPAPLPLVKDGQLLRRNMRKEMITTEELMSLLREQGVESLDEVRRCYLEGDGHVSVIKSDAGGDDGDSQSASKNVPGA